MARASSSRPPLPRGGLTSPAQPTSSRRWCGSWASLTCPPRRCAARRASQSPVLTETQKRQRLARRVLAARGLVEAVTWSFIAPEHAKLFGGGAPELVLSNPISSELAVMRPSLLPGLITAAQRNRDRGFADGALFELGQAYRGAKPEDQFVAASGVRFGHSTIDGSGRALVGRGAACWRVCRQGRRHRRARGARRRSGQYHGRARGAGLVPSRPLGRAQARTQDRARRLRRAPPGPSRRRSASMRRSRASSFISTRFPRRSARARPSLRSRHRIFSRSSATSPSCSIAMLPRATWCARRPAQTAR